LDLAPRLRLRAKDARQRADAASYSPLQPRAPRGKIFPNLQLRDLSKTDTLQNIDLKAPALILVSQ